MSPREVDARDLSRVLSCAGIHIGDSIERNRWLDMKPHIPRMIAAGEYGALLRLADGKADRISLARLVRATIRSERVAREERMTDRAEREKWYT